MSQQSRVKYVQNITTATALGIYENLVYGRQNISISLALHNSKFTAILDVGFILSILQMWELRTAQQIGDQNRIQTCIFLIFKRSFYYIIGPSLKEK